MSWKYINRLTKNKRGKEMRKGLQVKEILKVRNFREWGYQIRTDLVKIEYDNSRHNFKGAYSLIDEGYIGSSRWAYRLWHRYGVHAQLIEPSDKDEMKTCQIGWSKRDQK